MIDKTTFKFLSDLNKNNRREWFYANKSAYQVARENVLDLIAMLIHHIAEFDNSLLGTEPQDCLFRIYRDVRFSKNKIPYKVWFNASLRGGGRKGIGAGYYISIQPGKSYLGGGLWRPSSEDLDKIRKGIISRTQEFENVLEAKEFKDAFGELGGEKLKTAPRGFSRDHPNIHWLRYKDFIVGKPISDKEIMEDQFLDYAVKSYYNMLPLKQFLNKRLEI